MGEEIRIENVSDTALWVAMYRAKESAREDALFKDPYASLLAGTRGEALAEHMKHAKMMQWILSIRTVGIDRLILAALSEGVDTVLNLGAGLDTRPYRMNLPPSLHWIEVDFPHIINLKNEKLKDETPVCHLERRAVDLSDSQKRKELFAEIGQQTKKVLVITEGVIHYLTKEQAEDLAKDLQAIPSFQFWIQDFRNGPRNFSWRNKLKLAPMNFFVEDWMAFFARFGWKEKQKILSYKLGQSLNRPFPFMFPWTLLGLLLPKAKQEKWLSSYGFVLLNKG